MDRIERESEISIVFKTMIAVGIFTFLLFLVYLGSDSGDEKQESNNKITLEDILKYEISQADINLKGERTCYDFMVYYNKSLRKYDGLDVRPIRYVHLCDLKMEDCNTTHATIFVAGLNQECLLEQNTYICIGFG